METRRIILTATLAVAAAAAGPGCSAIKSKVGLGSKNSAGPARPAEARAGASGGGSATAAKRPAEQPIDRSRVPTKLADMLDALEGDPSSRHVLRNKFAKLDAAAVAFAPKWDAYVARKAEVDAVLAEVEELERGKRWDAARQRLEQTITPPVRDERGKIARERAMVEPFDAELPAVYALIRVTAAQKDYVRLAEAGADLYIRRQIGDDRDRELMLWMVGSEYDIVHGMSQVDRPFVEELLREAHTAGQHGGELALQLMSSLGDFGLARGNVTTGGAYGDAKWGLLVFDRLDKAKIDGNQVKWSRKTTWEEPYDCVLTDKIDSINPVTGSVTYKRRCKFRRASRTVKLDGKLAGPLPAWRDNMGMASTYLVARIERPGPDWVLANIAMPDLRYLEYVQVYPWQSPF